MNISEKDPDQGIALKRTSTKLLLLGVTVLLLLIGAAVYSVGFHQNTSSQTPQRKEEEESKDEVALESEALEHLGIETGPVISREPTSLVSVTGTVEANQEKIQQITPLVSGRVAQVYAAIGSRIRKGQLLAIISSPQVAEQHGKLHEAETRLSLAEENLKRVKRMENRVAILKGKADLDLATSNLAMEKQLFKEQISSRQALIAAQSDYDRAKAEYAFQNDIALNREIAAANSELRTAQAEMLHLKQGLIAQDAALDESGNIERDISIVQLHAPMSGIIVERFINAGAGVEAGKPIFTVADASSVWIIANVPESQVNAVRTGMDALIAPLAGSTESIKGVINYIDPRMNEDTRSARVRIEVQNSNQLLKLGMFAQVTIPIESQAPGKAQILIPADAVQQLPDRTIVFVPEDKEPGHFHVKEVDVGKEADGFRLVKAGLSAGDIVVTKGGFALKSKLLKAQFGGDND